MQKYINAVVTKGPILFQRRFAHSTACCSSVPSGSTADTASIAAAANDEHQLNVQKPSLIGSIEQPILGQPTATEERLNKAIGAETVEQKIKEFPAAPNPELCCGSGCPNCIWIQYAEEVLNYVKTIPLHSGVEEQQKRMVKDALKRNVQDENLRIYLLMEIQAKGV